MSSWQRRFCENMSQPVINWVPIRHCDGHYTIPEVSLNFLGQFNSDDTNETKMSSVSCFYIWYFWVNSCRKKTTSMLRSSSSTGRPRLSCDGYKTISSLHFVFLYWLGSILWSPVRHMFAAYRKTDNHIDLSNLLKKTYHIVTPTGYPECNVSWAKSGPTSIQLYRRWVNVGSNYTAAWEPDTSTAFIYKNGWLERLVFLKWYKMVWSHLLMK